MTVRSNTLDLPVSKALDPEPSHDIDSTHARVEALSRIMDSAVRIPGTQITVGLDALIGVVPVAGNIVTTLISSYIILESRRLGVSKLTLLRMLGNVGLDSLISAVPIAGNIGDVFFKANRRNLALLQRHIQARRSLAESAEKRR